MERVAQRLIQFGTLQTFNVDGPGMRDDGF